jgi:hypothetical protein
MAASLKSAAIFIPASPPKLDYAALIRNQREVAEIYLSRFTRLFAEEVESGKLNPVELKTLVEICSRVPEDILLPAFENNEWKSPSQAYAWLILHSNVVIPYVSLKEASEKLKSSFENAPKWGYLKGRICLPKYESLMNSDTWTFIYEFVKNQYSSDAYEFTAEASDSVPKLEPEDIAQNSTIDVVLIRLLELMRNPTSATIRRGTNITPEDIIRNMVDFILLEYVFRESGRYSNLQLNSATIKSGRRPVKISTAGKSGKMTTTIAFQGYALAEKLLAYIPKKTGKAPETSEFFRLVQGLLTDLISESQLNDWEIPKHVLEVPSLQIRSNLRRGPSVTTRKGVRTNLYIPLSYVKSSECSSMPEVTRKDLTHTGDNILLNIDRVNKLPIHRANEALPYFKEYLQLTYIVSDEIRNNWRKQAFIPGVEALNARLVTGFNNLWNEDDINIESLRLYNMQLKIWCKAIPFSPVGDQAQIDRVLAEISELLNKKKNTARR